MQTVLITGASGFAGSRFIRRRGSVYKLLIPSHSEMGIIVPDFERFSSGHERNLSVSTEKIVRASVILLTG